MPTEAESAYAAGLYEGEGSCSGTRSIYLVITMTDKQPLERMRQIFQGSLNGPYAPHRPNREQPYCRWLLVHRQGVLDAFQAMKPWLSDKRIAQIEKALIRRPVLKPRGHANFPKGRICPSEPIPSQAGYQHHRKLNEPACQICLDSFALYMRQFHAKKLSSG